MPRELLHIPLSFWQGDRHFSAGHAPRKIIKECEMEELEFLSGLALIPPRVSVVVASNKPTGRRPRRVILASAEAKRTAKRAGGVFLGTYVAPNGHPGIIVNTTTNWLALERHENGSWQPTGGGEGLAVAVGDFDDTGPIRLVVTDGNFSSDIGASVALFQSSAKGWRMVVPAQGVTPGC